ncbi:right-handed parallel beta-helix repeat-containing protein [Paraliomyxa miuraensis]|uniref:right-handed parallel beta-helix repeat-containing protein n=1 Tax=Paraliomyxa miuraensis TaxID=376150 RepID=UPI00224D57B3|nr:right-handed parallel beta-helix repeat-containing protein [Paraliomyxa miuraensis]MCX4245559.1 right-handed parallel beta-helix repeat-containing protein [Paraliomyxa miuraensis]
MSAEDVMRLLVQPWKHYVGARLQMARPTIDSDFNENAISDDEDWRQATLAMVGAAGRVDQGFLPDLVPGDSRTATVVRFGAFVQTLAIEFDLRPGTMYAGGRRFDQPKLEPVLFQREYLQMGPATAPRAVTGTHQQMAYLFASEQPVSAVEDAELLEPALGGADGALRDRLMRRVEVRAVQAQTCEAAFGEVLDALTQGTTLDYDQDTCELRSGARLQVGFASPVVEDDCPACVPSLRGRHLGRENHTFRVMLASPDSYVWAFDDGAPLYRVKVVPDGPRGARVDLLTPPKDDDHHPGLDTVVELLPWSALLDNGQPQGGKLSGERVRNEKVSVQQGFFARVDGVYQPSSRSMHVRLPAAARELGLGTSGKADKSAAKAASGFKSSASPVSEIVATRWDARHPHADELNPTSTASDGSFEAHLYMRVWHRQSDGSFAIPTSSSAPLGQTGLVPIFSGRGRPGDFWTFSVRPSAPDEVVPRELMRLGGIAPHGPRTMVVPIALMEWSSTGGTTQTLQALHDCRPRIRALTDRGCDTFIVGPNGQGDFARIQTAIDHLPPAGGRIVVLPGIYEEQLVIEGRRNVTIVGCGARSRIATPPHLRRAALVRIGPQAPQEDAIDTSHVTLRDLALLARGQIGVLARGERIVLDRLDVRAEASGGSHDDGPGPAPTSAAVVVDGSFDVRVTRCRIVQDGGPSLHAAVYVQSPGLGALVEDNVIEVESIDGRDGQSWGGIQVGGGSREIEIRRNRITGGRGHGITLGSASFWTMEKDVRRLLGAGMGLLRPELSSASRSVLRAVDERLHPEPDPPLEDVLIEDNEVTGAGGSGIGSLAMAVVHRPEAMAPPLCLRATSFVVEGLTVRGNRIQDNARAVLDDSQDPLVRGGVALGESIRLRVVGNVIRDHGRGKAPVCGVFVGRGRDLRIERNRIERNGTLEGPADTDRVVARGGIVLIDPGQIGVKVEWIHEAGLDAVLVVDNVVEHYGGPALSVVTTGPCTVRGNHLTAATEPVDPTTGRGPVVLVVVPGRPWEAVDVPEGAPSPTYWLQPPLSVGYLHGQAQKFGGPGGGLTFSSNQITTGWAGQRGGRRGRALPVILRSADTVVMRGNQLAARVPNDSMAAHALVMGAAVSVTSNRVAEPVGSTSVSMICAPFLLTCSTDNVLTHCHVPDAWPGEYDVIDGNLVLLRPDDGCRSATKRLGQTINALVESFFGLSPALNVKGQSIAMRRAAFPPRNEP